MAQLLLDLLNNTRHIDKENKEMKRLECNLITANNYNDTIQESK